MRETFIDIKLSREKIEHIEKYGVPDVFSAVEQAEYVEKLFDRNKKEIADLLKEFADEYPPIKGKRGYLLVGKMCGKKCPKCPHSLIWKRYNYKLYSKSRNDYIFWWVNENGLTALPSSFHKIYKEHKSYQRFMYYNNRMKLLNAQRKKLTGALNKIRHAYQSVTQAKVFHVEPISN
jgi:tRNA U34 5-carboxymethylaminomethyl modifying GTPase MnmE/TrmE